MAHVSTTGLCEFISIDDPGQSRLQVLEAAAVAEAQALQDLDIGRIRVGCACTVQTPLQRK